MHATGTARTEGFYKITYQEKKKYLKRLQTISQDKTQDNQVRKGESSEGKFAKHRNICLAELGNQDCRVRTIDVVLMTQVLGPLS